MRELPYGLVSMSSNGPKLAKVGAIPQTKNFTAKEIDQLEPMTKEEIDCFFSEIANIAKKYKAGNCMHMTAVAYDYLKKSSSISNIKIDILFLLQYEHAFIRLTLNDTSVICDPWDNDIYLHTEENFKKKIYNIISNPEFVIFDNDTRLLTSDSIKDITNINCGYVSVCDSFVGKERKIFNLDWYSFFKQAAPVIFGTAVAATHAYSQSK